MTRETADQAWVTLATNDTYALGALVLAHSLNRTQTTRQLVCLITLGVSESMRSQLATVFDIVKLVDILDSGDEATLALMKRPELGITFTKLHCWKLTQFKKCVFLDADTLVLQNCDELFERDELSAAPDVGWPDCFNSGVFVYVPSLATSSQLIELGRAEGSFDGGDQGLLNAFFKDWPTADIRKHLPFIYNVCASSVYSYLPAFQRYSSQVKIIHFLGDSKPWAASFNSETKQVTAVGSQQHIRQFYQAWWDIFCLDVHRILNSEMTGLASMMSRVTLGQPPTGELQDLWRRERWESGNIDYLGLDSFDSILKHVQDTLKRAQEQAAETAPAPPKQAAEPVTPSVLPAAPTEPVPPSDQVPQPLPEAAVPAPTPATAQRPVEPAKSVPAAPEKPSTDASPLPQSAPLTGDSAPAPPAALPTEAPAADVPLSPPVAPAPSQPPQPAPQDKAAVSLPPQTKAPQSPDTPPATSAPLPPETAQLPPAPVLPSPPAQEKPASAASPLATPEPAPAQQQQPVPAAAAQAPTETSAAPPPTTPGTDEESASAAAPSSGKGPAPQPPQRSPPGKGGAGKGQQGQGKKGKGK